MFKLAKLGPNSQWKMHKTMLAFPNPLNIVFTAMAVICLPKKKTLVEPLHSHALLECSVFTWGEFCWVGA